MDGGDSNLAKYEATHSSAKQEGGVKTKEQGFLVASRIYVTSFSSITHFLHATCLQEGLGIVKNSSNGLDLFSWRVLNMWRGDKESTKTSDPGPQAAFVVGGHDSYYLCNTFSALSILL